MKKWGLGWVRPVAARFNTKADALALAHNHGAEAKALAVWCYGYYWRSFPRFWFA